MNTQSPNLSISEQLATLWQELLRRLTSTTADEVTLRLSCARFAPGLIPWFIPWAQISKHIEDFEKPFNDIVKYYKRFDKCCKSVLNLIESGAVVLPEVLPDSREFPEQLQSLENLKDPESWDHATVIGLFLWLAEHGEEFGNESASQADRLVGVLEEIATLAQAINSSIATVSAETQPKMPSCDAGAPGPPPLEALLRIQECAYQFSILNQKPIAFDLQFPSNGSICIELPKSFDEPRLLAKFFGDGEFLRLMLDIAIELKSTNRPTVTRYSNRCLECGQLLSRGAKYCRGKSFEDLEDCRKKFSSWLYHWKGGIAANENQLCKAIIQRLFLTLSRGKLRASIEIKIASSS